MNWMCACSDSLEQSVCMQNNWGSTACIQRWGSSTAYNWVFACRSGVRQPWTGCVHAEVGFNSLELGVCMQRCRGSTALNWVCACRGGVRQPWTGCVHAEAKVGPGIKSVELSNPEPMKFTFLVKNSRSEYPSGFKIDIVIGLTGLNLKPRSLVVSKIKTVQK